jgi:lysyl-tRNA synthetase class 2
MSRPTRQAAIDPRLVQGRMAVISAARRFLEGQGYAEVQTPVLHPRLAGFERGTGFSTYSASLGERLWFRAAPELYLKRLLIDWPRCPRAFELAVCLRDEAGESFAGDRFDRPEFTLLEAYARQDDHWPLEGLLRRMTEQAIKALERERLLTSPRARQTCARLRKSWRRVTFAELLRGLDRVVDVEALLRQASGEVAAKGKAQAAQQAKAIEARASDTRLRDACASLAYRAGNLARYLRTGPQGYWYDFLDHAFRTKVAPSLEGPVIVHGLPVESSPLAASSDGIHCDKWELYLDGVRVALAQRELMDAQAQTVRFQHLDNLRRLGYDLLPEPDEGFLKDLERWPSRQPLIGLGVYMDRLAGSMLGLAQGDGAGQDRMIPNLFKG